VSADQVGLSVVVPVYDEVETLEPLVARVVAAIEPLEWIWELILVDDGSTDGSAERMEELAARHRQLRPVHLAGHCGQSAALHAGFTSSRGTLVATLDADLQTSPEEIPRLVEELEARHVDAVVGIRVERSDSLWRRLSARLANWVRNWLTSEDIVDTGCPLKVFRGEAIRSVRAFDGMHRFLPTLLKMDGRAVAQVPVRHAARMAGRSKYGTVDRALRGLHDALAVRWMQRRALRWRLR